MSRYAETFLLLATFAGLAAGSEPTQAERERRVKVALALADAKPTKPAAKVAAPVVGLDWFGDRACECCQGTACTCGPGHSCGAATCPAGCKLEMAPPPHKAPAPAPAPVAAVEYRVEYQQQCSVDAWGRKTCRMVPVYVPVQK